MVEEVTQEIENPASCENEETIQAFEKEAEEVQLSKQELKVASEDAAPQLAEELEAILIRPNVIKRGLYNEN